MSAEGELLKNAPIFSTRTRFARAPFLFPKFLHVFVYPFRHDIIAFFSDLPRARVFYLQNPNVHVLHEVFRLSII